MTRKAGTDMTTITANRLDGSEAIIESEIYDEFESGLYGIAFTPESDGYEAARKVWNGMIDKRPAIIVRCGGVSDVVNAVKFAREHELMLSLRGGAHSIAGHGTCDGGIVIDLSPMKGVRVDAENKTAHAQAGLTWAELDNETELTGREFEPWRPILAVARLFERYGVDGLENRMRQAMRAYQEEKNDIDSGDRAWGCGPAGAAWSGWSRDCRRISVHQIEPVSHQVRYTSHPS